MNTPIPAVTVLGKASSINVRKVLWLCEELQLKVVQEDWGSGFLDTNTPAFLALNPNGMVPVLRDGELTLWESNTICRYLASRCQRTDLLPATAAERARVEQWMDWQATEFNNAWRYAFMARVRQSPQHQDPHAIAASETQWQRHIDILAAQLERTGAYAVGEHFTLADIPLGLSVHRWLQAPVQKTEPAAIPAYYARLSLRPGFVKFGVNGGG